MFVALIVIHVIVAISLVLVVLLQQGRGAELGAAFGGLGQATYGRGQYTFVHKLTTGLAIVFMVTSLSLAFISTERPQSSILAPGASQSATTEQPGNAPAGDAAAPTSQAAPAAAPAAAGTPATAPGAESKAASAPQQQAAPPATAPATK